MKDYHHHSYPYHWIPLVFTFLFWTLASLEVEAADPTSNHLRGNDSHLAEAEDTEGFHSRNLQGKPIDGSFIVAFDDDVQDPQSLMDDIVKKFGGVKTYEYDVALQGFAVTGLPPGQEKKVAKTKGVKLVELDTIVALGPEQPSDVTAVAACTSPEETPWGVTRVTTTAPISNYAGPNQAWVIDTGIDLDHPDLNVNASMGFSAFKSGQDKTFDDLEGHGTHVAGIIAAKSDGCGVVGVAPGAQVIPVKVLNSRGSGTTSGVIAGVNHVASKGKPGDVANMSLGGGVSTNLDNAVINAALKGIFFTVAAGNEATVATSSSPARANGQNIFTISSMDINDNFARYSNYGNPPVDYCAPGVGIKSTFKGGGYASLSGTSMAAPHAAGVLLMTNGFPATSGTVKNDPDGTPDPIIHI